MMQLLRQSNVTPGEALKRFYCGILIKILLSLHCAWEHICGAHLPPLTTVKKLLTLSKSQLGASFIHLLKCIKELFFKSILRVAFKLQLSAFFGVRVFEGSTLTVLHSADMLEMELYQNLCRFLLVETENLFKIQILRTVWWTAHWRPNL